MNLCVTTDFVTSQGNPEPYLRLAAEAGFTHVHYSGMTDVAGFLEEAHNAGRRLEERVQAHRGGDSA